MVLFLIKFILIHPLLNLHFDLITFIISIIISLISFSQTFFIFHELPFFVIISTFSFFYEIATQDSYFSPLLIYLLFIYI